MIWYTFVEVFEVPSLFYAFTLKWDMEHGSSDFVFHLPSDLSSLKSVCTFFLNDLQIRSASCIKAIFSFPCLHRGDFSLRTSLFSPLMDRGDFPFN